MRDSPPAEHKRNLTVQTALVRLECGFALALKRKTDTRIQVHHAHRRIFSDHRRLERPLDVLRAKVNLHTADYTPM
jgi:hypothetical protein